LSQAESLDKISLRYGNDLIDWDLSGDVVLFDVRDPKSRCDPERFFLQAGQAIDSARPDLSRVGIVVADKTRLCNYPIYLPRLMEAFEKRGIDSGRIRFFIAYSTHARQSDAESFVAYGEVYRRFTFIHHDGSNPDSFALLGETSRKIPVLMRKDLLECTFVLTFGAISHHYFAGYGGGRKLIFPGLGFREAVYLNHALFLDRAEKRLAPGCRPGVLDGNPLAEDLEEHEAFFQAHMAIHGILDRNGKVCELIFGAGPSDFRKACAEHARNCELPDGKRYSWVLASCGGHPRDINFIQSHKAIQNASLFVEDGGTLVALARCRDGVGSSTFLPYFSMEGFAGAFERLSMRYEGNGGTALSMMTKTARIRIIMITDLDEKTCRIIGVKKVSHNQALRYIQNRKGAMAVLPNAGLLVRVPKGPVHGIRSKDR